MMQWIVVAVLARHDGAAAVGSYALALAIAAPVFTLSMLQLRMLLVTAPDPAAARGPYLAARVCTSVVALVVVLGCALVVSGATAVLLVAIGLARCCETVGDLLLGCLQGEGHVDRVGRDQTLLAAASTGIFTVALIATGQLREAIWVLPMCSLVFGLWVPGRQVRASLRAGEPLVVRADFARGSVLRVVRAGLPLGGSSSVGALGVAVPRFVLQSAHGSATVGVYSGVSQLSQALTAVAGAVSQARLPVMVRQFHHGAGTAPLVRAVLTAVGLCTAGGVALAGPAYLWGPDLVRLLYGAGFVVDRGVMALLAVATGVLSCTWFLDQALVTQRRTRTQLAVNLLGLAVTTLCCLVLVPRDGLVGAAAAVTLAAAVQCLVKTWVVVQAAHRAPALVEAGVA
jgi:O-antigen/teichoic acid export membrane protein